VNRSLHVRLSRLERSNQPLDAVARIVFGDDEPPPGNGPLIRVSWCTGNRPPLRWLTRDNRFSPEEDEAVDAEISRRFGDTAGTGPRDPEMSDFTDAEFVAIAIGERE
jgi:hypothetical protein